MHDIRFIREFPAEFDAALARRGEAPHAESILAIDAKRRERIHQAELAHAERNRASRRVGAAKAHGDEVEFERLRGIVASKKSEITRLEELAREGDESLRSALLVLPNLPLDDVPDGADEADNLEVRRWGNRPDFAFTPLEHFEIPAAVAGLDFTTAAKLSGSRFVMLTGGLARIHRALAQFMIDLHVNHNGLTEIWSPVLVHRETMVGTGQLPKFREDSYQTTDGHWLIPTSEVTLTNIVRDSIVSGDGLPKRFCAHTQCFRSEAGAAGRDTAGMLRQHQFEKVEMVSIVKPEDGLEELARMRRCAEDVLERLGLPYRTVVLCVGDMGFGARKTFDLEVWLPGQGKYREISSVSYCGDFQARRMNARFRRSPADGPEFVHSLNGSGLAVGRALIALLENNQLDDGSVQLPSALEPYLDGRQVLTVEGRLE